MKGPGKEAIRTALRHLAGAGVAALILFHGWLVARRLADPAGLEPGIALRWLAAFAVVGGLLWLRSRGLPLFRGRKALAAWTVAILIHGNAGAAPLPGDAEGVPGTEALVLVLPGALSLVTASALLLLAGVSPRRALVARPLGLVLRPAPRPLLLSPCLAGHGPRPPPAC